MPNTIKLRAQCHCGKASYKYELPVSDFPLKSALCHCHSCRHVSGHLFAIHAVIPHERRPDVSHLKAYRSSSSLTRYFCPCCGATICNYEEQEWEFASGVLSVEGKPEQGALNGLLDTVQLWLADVSDGGGSIWLSGDWHGKRYLQNRYSADVSDDILQKMVKHTRSSASHGDDGNLHGHCHCGDIKLTITRSDPESKYPAGLDACMSCRKVTGFEITSWATIPYARISVNGTDGFNIASAQLSHYMTSSDVARYFCTRCGATIFYLKERRDTVDVGVGLLDTRQGSARAEEWLTWDKYEDAVAFSEDAADQGLVVCLVKGILDSREKELPTVVSR